MRKRICALVLALLLTVLPALATGQSAPNDPVVQALFINVGKADSALLLLGEKRYLVDAGSKESAAAMLDALAHFGVDRLEGVFITHTDKDHVGGLGALLKSGIQVEKLYAPAYFIQKNITIFSQEKIDTCKSKTTQNFKSFNRNLTDLITLLI